MDTRNIQYLIECVPMEHLPKFRSVVHQELAAGRHVPRRHCEHMRPPVHEDFLKEDVLLAMLKVYSAKTRQTRSDHELDHIFTL